MDIYRIFSFFLVMMIISFNPLIYHMSYQGTDHLWAELKESAKIQRNAARPRVHW